MCPSLQKCNVKNNLQDLCMTHENQVPSQSRFTHSERIVPFAAGLAVSGAYLYATSRYTGQDHRLTAIKTIVLCSLSFARGFCTENSRQNIYFFALPISAGALYWRAAKNRNQALIFATALAIQSIGMHLLGERTRRGKRNKLHLKFAELSLFGVAPIACYKKGQALIQSLSYAEDRTGLSDEVQSFYTILLLAGQNFKKAKKIARTICDLEKRVNALMRIAEHNVDEKEQLIDECLSLKLPTELYKVLQFEKQKCAANLNQIIIPPKSENHTGLSQEQWSLIKKIFSEILSKPVSSFLCTKNDDKKRTIAIMRPGDSDKYEWTCPFTIKLLGEKNFLLMTKAKTGEGAQQTIKTVYDLTTGKYYAKKKVLPQESNIVNSISNLAQPGLPRVAGTEKSEEIHKIYLPKFDCDLSQALANGMLRTRIEKLAVVKQLLRALEKLHNHNLYNSTYTPRGGRPETAFEIGPIPLMHGDIKLQNIVFNKGTSEIMLIDFDTMLHLGTISGTFTYLDPETLQFYDNPLKRIPNYDAFGNEMPNFDEYKIPAPIPNIEFNAFGHVVQKAPQPEDPKDVKLLKYHLEFGQKRDVWAAGITIAILLFGEKNGMPNLSVFQDCLRAPTPIIEKHKGCDVIAYNIRQLTQLSIDQCLDRIGQEKEPLAPLLKSMLKIDAKERISSEKASEQFRNLIADFDEAERE